MTTPAPWSARSSIVAAILWTLSGNLACVGEIGGSGPSYGTAPATGQGPTGPGAGGSTAQTGAGGTTGPTGSGGSTGQTGTGGSTPATEPVARIEKLTAAQFANSVHDLLGQAAPLGPVEPDDVVDGFSAVGASVVSISPSGVGEYEAATGTATQYAFADATHAAAVLSCVPKSTSDTACMTQALNAFGRRAFRRPLTTDETNRYLTLATTIGNQSGSSVLAGMRHAVWAMLQSPNFLYRVELGAPSAADGGRLKYTSFEMASRLASALWNSVPDDTLLDAAASDALQTADGVAAQAQRMLAMPQAKQAVVAFADDLYGMAHLAETTKDPAMFPKWTPTLQASLQQELEQRVVDVVLNQHADYLSLYDSRSTFVNSELASFYGLPAVSGSGFQAAQFPASSPRVGLLGSGAILAAYALPQRTSPTQRGKFIAEKLLCYNIPPPPPGVPPLPSMAGSNATLRQTLEAHRSAPQCASCHAIMDPLGFGLENFDSAGQYRTTDNGQPVDATGSVGGVAFDGLAQMATALRQQSVAGPCLVSKVYENALGRTLLSADGAALDALAHDFAASGNRLDQLLVSLVSSDAFRFVQPNSP
jgi:hypothetical protein